MATSNIKQEFFHLLNLVATKNVKVKYCRTIKERLRPKTQEESTTLPKSRSPVKKKVDDVKSESVGKLEIKGGLTVLQSYKSKKKCRKKKETQVTPPSSKSLLSYLHARVSQADSSSAESDFSDQETTNRPSGPGSARASNGFSEDSVSKSRQQNQNLKNLINGLESETPGSRELEVVKDGSDVIMRMVEDFGLMSESDSEDEQPENLHHQMSEEEEEEEKSKISKPNRILIEDREPRDARITEEDMILREMLARFNKLENGKSDDKFVERFQDPHLVELVKKVRRESKNSRKFRNSLKKKKCSKGRILQRYNYLSEAPDVKPRKPYECFLLSEESKSVRRLERPSTEERLRARRMNKIDLDISVLTTAPSGSQPKTEAKDVCQEASQPGELKVEEDSAVEASRKLICQISGREVDTRRNHSGLVEDEEIVAEKINLVDPQYKVEGGFCDNIVYNACERTSSALSASSKVPNSKPESVQECSEKIEDIRRFLAESEDGQSLKEVVTKVDPKARLKASRKVSSSSELKFTKESALKIISESSILFKKNHTKAAKVQSFEDALNAALTPAKKVSKPVTAKTVQKAVVIPSAKTSQSEVKSTKLVSPVKSVETSLKPGPSPEKTSPRKVSVRQPVDVVSKIISQIDQSQALKSEKKPVMKALFSSGRKSPPRTDNNDGIKLESKRIRLDSLSSSTSLSPGPGPQTPSTSQDIFNSLKKIFGESQESSLSSPVKYSFPPALPVNQADFGADKYLPSPLSPVKRVEAQAQGYYTSSPSKTESFQPKSTPTLLPAVFPTFDSPTSSQRSLSLSSSSSQSDKWPSIIHSGSKPTAVVPPSSRSKMPALPKPVPAALGFSPVCEGKLAGFVCSQCGESFSNNIHLTSHLQTQHYY